MYYVYHIKLPHHGLDQGYIGISINPRERWNQHRKRNKGKNSVNPILTNVFNKYKGQLEYKILAAYENEHDVLWHEYTLRPQKNMGWNIAIGGAKCPMHGIGGHSEATRKKISESHKGKKKSPEAIANYIAATKGKKKKPYSEERKASISGHNSPRAKPVNIYCYKTNELLYENVVLRQWAKENNGHHSNLGRTLKADRSKPSTKYNVCHYRNMYAVEVEKDNV
jgi:hypothetical protein